MEALADLSWRAYPAGLLIALGGAGFAAGLSSLARSFRMSAADRARPIVFVSGFRAGVVGLALTGLGAAWLSQQLWVLLLALAIGGEELLETSVVLFALRRGRRLVEEQQRAKLAAAPQA
jgi:hypothetical protein